MRSKLFTFFCMLLCITATAQVDTTEVVIDSVVTDITDIDTTDVVVRLIILLQILRP